jgi:mutual gliding-motility protein MglA
VQVNFAAKEVVLKLVYYGPALSGKTSNLKALHDCIQSAARGRLMTLATKDDRTLFFDMLPLAVRTDVMSLRIKVFTVPGQVLHASTRRFVLQGADGVAFIADSQTRETENNALSFRDLAENVKELGKPLRQMPLVIQFNKRDLAEVRTEEELRGLAAKGREPVYTASAVSGVGVFETFFGLLALTVQRLEEEHRLSQTLGIPNRVLLQSMLSQFGLKKSVDDLVAASLGARATIDAVATPGAKVGGP